MNVDELACDEAWPRENMACREELIDSLARRCGVRARSIAHSLVGSRPHAEELVQDALLRAFERFDDLRNPRALDAWFYRILTTLCLNAVRKRNTWNRIKQLLRSDEYRNQESKFFDDRVLNAVAKLPRRQRVAIALRYGGDLSVAEVAVSMEVSLATAKTHLVRGLKKLRLLLGGTR